MIERREFISICRQIGTMMDVGVDFLRITQALRAQTDNPRLLELYDQLDFDLKEGDSLSEAMSHAPDVFSAFAVSLIQQGEARGNIEGSWQRIADFFQQEAREDLEIGADDAPLESFGGASPARASFGGAGGGSSSRLALSASEFWDRGRKEFGHVLIGSALLLGCLALARGALELGLVERRFGTLLELGTAALFLAGAGVWMETSRERKGEPRCAFCGRAESRDLPLVRSPLARVSTAEDVAICADCAGQVALGAPLGDAARAQQRSERQGALQTVADALPEHSAAIDEDTIVLDDDDPLAPPPAPRR